MESKLLDKAEVKASDDEMAKKYMEKVDQLLLTDSDDEYPDIECVTCSKSFPTVQMFEQHLNSKKHYKMMNKMKSMQKLGPDAPKRKSAEDPLINSDSGEELYCEVCDKEMSGYISYMAHIKGSVHAKNLRQHKLREKVKMMEGFVEDDLLDGEEEDDNLQKPFARCKTCCKTFSGPESYEQHVNGANHKKKLRQLKVIESLKKDEDTENGVGDDESYSKCEVCNKTFSGPVPYKVHLMSSVHFRELQRVKAEKELEEYFERDADGTKLVCKECKKTFSDPLSLKSHLSNNSHGKQKVKDEMFGFVASNPEIVAVKSVQNLSSDEDEETNEKENFQNGHYFLVCKLCHMSFSGPESARDHLESKKHVKVKNEKAERKILKEKLKDKQNGRPAIDSKASEIVDMENSRKDPSTNGEKKGLVPSLKKPETSNVQEDFEFI